MSGDIVSALRDCKAVPMTIDFEPDITKEQLDRKFAQVFAAEGKVYIKNALPAILPKALAEIFLSLLDIVPRKYASQLSKRERLAVADTLKAFPLTITGSLGFEEAMVTSGGVVMKDINPRTMESKIVSGVYFAGEVMEGRAPSGGYNLQQAFSTGYLAGQSSAHSLGG